jgi:hypothetical protein
VSLRVYEAICILQNVLSLRVYEAICIYLNKTTNKKPLNLKERKEWLKYIKKMKKVIPYDPNFLQPYQMDVMNHLYIQIYINLQK